MSEDFSTKSVLVFDCGLFVSLAELLVGKFGKVGYFKDWQSGFADGRELMVGQGLEGITRENHFFDVVDSYDLIIFPDCWHGDLQEYLRANGKRVWGAGNKSFLELSRWKTHELMKETGLPINEATHIQGIENLRAFLAQNEDVFVKISGLRGIGETFHSESYDLSKNRLDFIQSKFGPLADILWFIIEKPIPDADEVGYDGYCIDGEFPNKSFYGAEIKDKAYFGRFTPYDDLPDEVKTVNTELSYHMDGYRQFFSTEIRGDVAIDLTCRHASPAGETFCHAFTNLADILWEGAAGQLVHAISSHEYCAQVILCSEHAARFPLAIDFEDDSARPFTKIYNHCRVNGQDWFMPQNLEMTQFGSVIGLGNTPEEAVEHCKANAKQVKAFQLYYDESALDEAAELMEKQPVE